MMDIASGVTLRSLWDQQAREWSDAEFLVFEDPDQGPVRRFTYREFDESINRAANVFLARGIGHGDRVAVQTHSSCEFVQCLFALAKIGAVTVPLNSSYTARECLEMTEQCGVRLLVSDSELFAQEGMEAISCDVIVVADGGGRPVRSAGDCWRDDWASLVAVASPVLGPCDPVYEDDLVEIMFTSGTESRPKGVMLTHANFVFSGLYCNWEMGMTPEDRLATAMVTSHVNFQLSALMPVLTAGATLVMLGRYSATRFWREIRAHGATLVQSMAMMVRTMMSQPVDPDERRHRVRDLHYFLPLSDGEKEAFEERFSVTLLNNYGATETLVGCLTDLPLQPRHWPSVGKAGLGYEVRIVDESGDAPVGGCGEILIHGVPGRSLMLGYWKDPEATAAAVDPDGWYHSGDLGYADAEGWIHFVDRHQDLIKRAGENVSATQVENVLMECPGVAEAAVVGIPDPVRDQAVKAVVVLDRDAPVTQAQVRAFAAARLAYFKVPSVIEVRDDLPRGTYGKVIKNLLKD
ncbi:MAG: AMP-binding protein [Actinomyces sp.]|jgi:crotonobetaine/carnitine-CoA ligase|nr:AMP-binding protein [Actinomyces sp.]MCI1691664.1 AMP-binding protein [Actinomyces sp.]MCI1788010.1 AMP-binding protein [Actinomyces sp.]MCI1830559.1 AMP-binding protein [Actinomyces sp.]